MPTAPALDRVQPSLFDRLIDLNPTARQEAKSERVLSPSRYREGVLRDLQWLLNSSAHIEEEGLDDYPQVQRSVFNFGKRGLTGVSINDVELSDIEDDIAETIRRFEPRIDPATLKVRCVGGGEEGQKEMPPGTYNCLGFEISGELWAHPAPQEFVFRTAIDMETNSQPA